MWKKKNLEIVISSYLWALWSWAGHQVFPSLGFYLFHRVGTWINQDNILKNLVQWLAHNQLMSTKCEIPSFLLKVRHSSPELINTRWWCLKFRLLTHILNNLPIPKKLKIIFKKFKIPTPGNMYGNMEYTRKVFLLRIL